MVERLFDPENIPQLRKDFEQAEAELGKDHDFYVTFADEVAEPESNLIK